LTSSYYQGSPLNQVLGIGATIGAGLGSTKTIDPKTGKVTETPNWLSELWNRSKELLPSGSLFPNAPVTELPFDPNQTDIYGNPLTGDNSDPSLWGEG
jgi:hypothetical protein